MIERDRLTRGFYAGVGAAVMQNVWSFLSFALGLTTLRMADWSAIAILSKEGPFSAGEILLGLVGHLIWSGLLGVIFVYLIPYVSHRHFILKGLLFSWTIWFLIYGISLLFKVEATMGLPLKTPVSNLVGSSIYGITLVWILNKLTEKSSAK